MRTILLKLAGPMQAWGTNSHFNIRHTDLYPSKSAIIGILAAAMGWRRNDERISSLNHFDFAVRVDQPGQVLKDYQIARQSEGKKDTYVTQRYYVEDAVFVAAVGFENDDLVNEIYSALQNPYFALFMGRRSLPVPTDFVLCITEKSVIDSLKEVPWQAADWYQKKMGENQERLDIYTDVATISGAERKRRDAVISFSDQGRKYSDRREIHTWVSLLAGKEHDAFAALEEL